MRAVVCRELGAGVTLIDLPDPSPGPGEVVLRVTAAALNFFDTLIIEGRYQTRPELPFSPSGECAGVVEALGAGVEGFVVGERVVAYLGYGAARERVVAPARRLVRIPDGVSDEQAAGLTVTYGTSLHALEHRARLKPGETVAVLGAAGGTGVAAIELAKLLGARVIACASSPEKLAFAERHGADDLLDYSAEPLREGLRRLTGGRGCDVIYDPVGGDLAEPALRSIAWQGRYLVIGFAGGSIPRIPLNLLLLKGCDMLGVFWGSFVERDPAGHVALMDRIVSWTADGRLSAAIHAVLPLEQAAEGIGLLQRRQATGKVILRV
jgi:NADPH:quinone reductase